MASVVPNALTAPAVGDLVQTTLRDLGKPKFTDISYDDCNALCSGEFIPEGDYDLAVQTCTHQLDCYNRGGEQERHQPRERDRRQRCVGGVAAECVRNRGAHRRGPLPARPLGVQPRVDVALAKAPLSANPDGGNLPGFDQPVHGPKVDLEVFQDFFCG